MTRLPESRHNVEIEIVCRENVLIRMNFHTEIFLKNVLNHDDATAVNEKTHCCDLRDDVGIETMSDDDDAKRMIWTIFEGYANESESEIVPVDLVMKSLSILSGSDDDDGVSKISSERECVRGFVFLCLFL